MSQIHEKLCLKDCSLILDDRFIKLSPPEAGGCTSASSEKGMRIESCTCVFHNNNYRLTRWAIILDVVEMEGSYSVCAGSLLFWRAQVRWNESTSVLRKYIYAEIPTKNPAIALQWALDWKEAGSIYIIGAACITISMWTCWHMSSKTMDVYPEKNFFWGIYPMCKMRFTNFSGRRPTWEYFGHLVTHWMKWVKKIAWWIVVKIMPIYGQCLEISTFKIVGAKTNNNNNIFSVAYI